MLLLKYLPNMATLLWVDMDVVDSNFDSLNIVAAFKLGYALRCGDVDTFLQIYDKYITNDLLPQEVFMYSYFK